ncbi:microtubule-associated protein 4 isoform X2 [Pithys albifrons albifrons]|uniref:microtubule-associated protein 4 isoform X2 n=1 Tax=Pithys albifrons albifrons TaxID=3385563 RepID=UPI003A5CBBE2
MADLEHNLSLADALAEPPPDIEEEVKRDFIATLEAEKFEDVVGETVDKTDYVPLLDNDDEGGPGSLEPKGRAHPEGTQGEHSSASGPTVVENGDHGLADHHTVFPGGVMDEKLSYKEFLERHDSWAEERELRFESQPLFRPLEMADPFNMHRGDDLPDLSFPTDMRNVPLFPGHADASRDILAPHGPVLVPEQPFLGPSYSPAEALDPSAFVGLEPSTQFLQDKAGPEEYWMGAQQDMKGPDASFFVEPPVPPSAPEAIRTSLPESPPAVARGTVPVAGTASPGTASPGTASPAEPAAAQAPPGSASEAVPVPVEKPGSVPAGDPSPAQALAPALAPAGAAANPFQAVDVGGSPAPEAKSPKAVNDTSSLGTDLTFTPTAGLGPHQATDLGFAPEEGLGSHQGMDLGFAPAEGLGSHHAMDLGFAPAEGLGSHQAMDLGFAPAEGLGSHQGMDLGFAPAADAEPPYALDLGFAPAEGVESHHAMDLGFAPAADEKPPHGVDLEFAPAADEKPPHGVDLGFAPAAEVNHHHHAMDLGFAPASDKESDHIMGSEFAPAAEVNHHHHAMDSGFAPAAEPKPLPTTDSAAAEPGPAADPKTAVPEELVTSGAALKQDKSPLDQSPAEATAKVEQECKVPEVRGDHLENGTDTKPPPSPCKEQTNHPPQPAAPAEAQEAVALDNKDLAEKSGPAVAVEAPKEQPEHNHVQHEEPQPGQALPEPTGVPTAQVRHAAHCGARGLGRAKAATGPLSAGPQQQPGGAPWQKSPEQRGCAIPGTGAPWQKSPDPHEQRGCATPGTGAPWQKSPDPHEQHGCAIPGTGAPWQKSPDPHEQRGCATPGTGAPWQKSPDPHEQRGCATPGTGAPWQKSPRHPPQDHSDLDGALGKKKKKKPKQRRNQMPRAMEGWDGNRAAPTAASSAPPAAGVQNPGLCPLAPGAAPGSRALEMPKDAEITTGSRILEEQSASSVPAPAQQAQNPRELDARPGGGMKAEGVRGVLERTGKSKEGPLEQVGKAQVGESVPAKGPPRPLERDFLDKSERREDEESRCANLGSVSKAGTPSQTKPSELPLSDTNRNPKPTPPKWETLTGTAHQPSLAPTAKENGEKSRGVEGESLRQAGTKDRQAGTEDKLPAEPKAAGGAPAGLEGGGQSPGGAAGGPGAAPPAPALQHREPDGIPSAPKHASPAKELGTALAAQSLEQSRGKAFIASEQQTGKDAGFPQGMDRPRKRRGEGKGKRMKSLPEHVVLLEDGSKSPDGGRVEEPGKEAAYPDRGPGSGARGHPWGSSAQAWPADRTHRRGSDGSSKRGERSFFQQPFPESRVDPGGVPELSDALREVSGKGREGGCVPAGALQEGTAETHSPAEEGPEKPRENIGKGEKTELGPLSQPLLLQSRREGGKHPALGDSSSQPEQEDLGRKGRGARGAARGAEKPRKRSSDGRRKQPERSPVGQAALLGTGGQPGPEEMAGSRKETTLDKEGSALGRENPAEVLGMPEIQGGSGSSSHQPHLSGHKTDRAEPGTGSAKGTLPMNAGEDAGRAQPLPGHRAGGMDSTKGGTGGGKGQEAENSPELGPGNVPAVGQVNQSQKSKGAPSRAPEVLLEHLSDPAKGQAPALPLEPQESHTGGRERHRKLEPDPQQQLPVLGQRAGAGTAPPRGLERRDTPEGASPSSRAANPSPEHPGVADPTVATAAERCKKRGSDGSRKRASSAPRQPLPPGAEPGRAEGLPPLRAELHQGLGDTELVDENRNIKNFPSGPQRLWDSKGSDSKSLAQSTGKVGDAPSGCPEQRDGGAGPGGLPPHPPPPPPPGAVGGKSSKEKESGAEEQSQPQKCEQPTELGQREPGEGESKAGQSRGAGCQGGWGAGQPLPGPPAATQGGQSERDTGKVGGEETKPSDGKPNAAKASLESKAAEGGQGGGKGGEQRAPQHPGGRAGADGADGTAAQATQSSPGGGTKGHSQPADREGARGGNTHLEGTLRVKSEGEEPQGTTREKGSQGTAREKGCQETTKGKETQDTVKEKESQETTEEKGSRDATKEKESQETTKEKGCQETTKEKETQDTIKEKGSQETIKEKEFQDTTKENESQETGKEKGCQETTKGKETQDTTKEKESQDTNKETQDTIKEKESQDTTKAKESQDTTREKESQDTTKEKESQDTTKEKESQDTTKEKESQDTTKEKESQDTTREKESQDTTKEKESQDTTREKESQDTTKATQATGKGKGSPGPAKARAEQSDPRAVQEARKERGRAAEQLKGYMRPTQSRGAVPAVPAVPAGRAAHRAVPRALRHRPDQAKPEEPKPTEAVTGNDITAPPNKELPPSPEKKTKPSAPSTCSPKAAAAKAKPAGSASPKRPGSATLGTNRKATSPPAAAPPASSARRPGSSTTRPSLTPKELKPKVADVKAPEKKPPVAKAATPSTARTPPRSSPGTAKATAASPVTAAAATKPAAPKRPNSIKTDGKPTEAKKTLAKSPSAELSRPKSAAGSATRSSATTPSSTTASSAPGATTSRPKPKAAATKAPSSSTASADAKKVPSRAPGRASTAPKPPRPPGTAGAPDLRHVRSKIGSTDNIKHQPGGGKGKGENRPDSAAAAPSPEPGAGTRVAPPKTAKEGPPKQPNGKVQIVSKKANYSHVQSKCGSKDNIKHVPGGGNVQIQNKKVDLSKVSSKCGSKANIKHKPGGGDVKIENQKLNFKEKAQAKVGSLDNVGHLPAGGTVKAQGGSEPGEPPVPPEGGAGPVAVPGAVPAPGAAPGALPGAVPAPGAVAVPGAAPALRENGVGPAVPPGPGEHRDAQSFETHIQETN